MSQSFLTMLLFTPLFLFIVVVGVCFSKGTKFNVPKEQAIRISIATVIGYSVLAAIIISSYAAVPEQTIPKADNDLSEACNIKLNDGQAMVIYNIDDAAEAHSRLKIENGYAIMFGEKQPQ